MVSSNWSCHLAMLSWALYADLCNSKCISSSKGFAPSLTHEETKGQRNQESCSIPHSEGWTLSWKSCMCPTQVNPIPSVFLPFLLSTLNFQLLKTLNGWKKPNCTLPNR